MNICFLFIAQCLIIYAKKLIDEIIGGKEVELPHCGLARPRFHIVGGKEALPGQFPWIASLKAPGSNGFCGGVILNTRWIVTAAHCCMKVSVSEVQKRWQIRVGTTSIYEGDIYGIDDMVIHFNFSKKVMNNDIALLKTKTPIKMKKAKAGYYIVNSICLPEVQEDHVGKAIVAGFGLLSFEGKQSKTLKFVDLPILTDKECAKMMHKARIPIRRSQMCTFERDRDACQGDSGGPAIQVKPGGRSILIGVVSFGITCADDFPGVYTQVSYFVNWIRETVLNRS